MPLHGTNNQRDAHYFFDIYYINKRKNVIIPKNIVELEHKITKKRESILFLESLYDEEYIDSTIDHFNEYTIETIDSYENASDEKLLFEESGYYVIDLGGYYIETKEGNYRNWVYDIELNTEYKQLKKNIVILEEELRRKILNIGVEIALLYNFNET